MHARKYRERGRAPAASSSPTRPSPPTTSPRRSAIPRERIVVAHPGIGAEFTPDGRGGRARRALPAHGRDARAAQEPRHARRGLRAARRQRARAARRRRARAGASSRSSTVRASCALGRVADEELAAPLPRRRGRRLPVALRGVRDADHRGDGLRARPSSPRRTPRSTRPAGDAARARRPREPGGDRGGDPRGARAARGAARARARPRARASPGGAPASSSSRGTGDSRRRSTRRRSARRGPAPRATCAGCSPTSTCRCSETSFPADLAPRARSPPTLLWYPRLAVAGADVLHCPTFRGPVLARASRSSSPCTTSPCCATRSGSTAGRGAYSRRAVPRVVARGGAR